MYSLLQQKVKWKWTELHETAFEKAKELLQSPTLLVHFDPQKDLIVTADASPYGLGAVLSHKVEDKAEQPIMFASRTLAPAEKNYSQIEKEALAIIFTVTKFHQYLHGRIHSDHKPLQFLFSESKQVPTMASARIQRWSLILGAYNYTIVYRPGTQIPHADAFSRLPIPTEPESVKQPGELTHLVHQLSTSIVTAQQIKHWTERDPLLSRVRRLVSAGWTVQEPDSHLQPFHNRRHELSIVDGCILWGSRVIIPQERREVILQQLHECHPGVTRMKSLARAYVWWPKIDSDIDSLVKTCDSCQQDRSMPHRSPIHPWEYPKQPWRRIHIDHAVGHTFLIVIDAHSKWIEAAIVPSTSTEATLKVLRTLFATHGIPESLVSDNGTGFTSQDFMSENGIRHSRTSPYHPSSNGLAERAVQTIKHGIAKLNGPIQHRLDRFLLQYRVTPHTTTGVSPVMGRRLRTRLDMIHPDSSKEETRKQQSMAGNKQPRLFTTGELVFAQDFSPQGKWLPAIIQQKTGPVSYKLPFDAIWIN